MASASTRKISGALVLSPLFKKQCAHIIKHLHELIQKTILEAPVIAYLQSRKILGEYDIATLTSIANYVDRNQKFYKLIQSRPGSYEVLIEALEVTRQTGIAQLLRSIHEENDYTLEECVQSCKKFSRLPPELDDFFKSDSDSICVVKTLDVKITVAKIKDNVENPCLHSFEDFLTFISGQNCSDDDDPLVHVIPDCNMKDVKLITRNQQIHQSVIKKLFILIHCNNEDELWEPEQPSSPSEVVPHICIDKMEWDDLSPAFMYEISRKLEAEFKIDSEHDPHLELGRILWGKLLTDIINGNELHLFKDTLPEDLSYYVERTLLTRNAISLHIFNKNSSDIYLVTGVERHELMELVPKFRTEKSSSQLQERSITVRFMILEHPSHFDRICEKTGHPIHWLHYDRNRGENLQWIKSRGAMTSVQLNIEKCQDNLLNDEFMTRLRQQDADNPNMPLCISDSPGMGKSVLLAQIGRKLDKMYPERLVLFIAISEFISQIKQTLDNDGEQAIRLTLQNLSCENELGKAIMKTKLISEEVTTELLLDGFDEVPSADLSLTYEILQTIKTQFKSVRLWITSRPHLLAEVENSLSVLGYKMKPFSEEDQLRFLTSFWSRQNQNLNTEQLTEFAQHCLNNLKCSEMSSDQDIAGVPLQCLLIGEVYEEEAINYAGFDNQPFSNDQRRSFPPTPNPISSITNLYQRLIQNRIKKYTTIYGASAMDPTELMEAHIQLSLELLFPQHFNELDEPIPLDEVLKVGLLESESTVKCPRFIHRTFAEYFVAWLMADWLVEGRLENALVHMIEKGCPASNVVLERETRVNPSIPHDLTSESGRSHKFVHHVICYFLNTLLSEHHEYPMSATISTNPFEVDIMFHSAKSIAHACAIQDFHHIFKVLVDMSGVRTQASNIFDKEFLLITIEHSCLELVKLAFEHFENFKAWHCDPNLQTKVLRAAVHRGELSILEFLIKEKGLREIVQELNRETGKLLHGCVENTLLSSESQLEQKLNIIRMLVGINGELLEAHDDDGRTPLLSYDVHVRLLIHLMELGANVFARDVYGATVLQYPLFGRYFKSHDYHLLITSIPEDKLRELVGQSEKHGEWNPLWRLVERIDPCPETLELFHTLGADFNAVSRYGYSILASAVKFRRNRNTIRKLMELGADMDWRGRRGETLLHVAAGLGNIEGLDVFLEEGIPVNVPDGVGLTPLDYAIKGEKISRRFETGMALHKLGGSFTQRINSRGQSLLHISARNGSMDSVQLLLKLGFDANCEDNDGNTPLHLSVVGSEFSFYNFDTVGILLEYDGINPNALNKNFETPLHHGLLHGRNFDLRTFHLLKSRTDSEWTPLLAIAAFQFLMTKMEDLYSEEFKELAKDCMARGASLDYKDDEGNSLLHQSAFKGNYRAVEYLVQQGIDVNIRNKMMETPLHKAAIGKDKSSDLQIIKYLIDSGDITNCISAKDEEGRTFLHKITENVTPSQYHDLVEYLIERKQENLFNATCWEYESTPFQRVVFHVELEEKTLQLMYSNGVDFNAIDKHGSSLLVYAVRGFRSANFLSSLIQLGADLRNLNNNGNNLLHVATVWGNVIALEYFLDRGGLDLNEVDGDGDTALHCVMLEGRKNVLEMSRMLVRKGADLNVPNHNGLTPMAIAVKRIKDRKLREELVELLGG